MSTMTTPQLPLLKVIKDLVKAAGQETQFASAEHFSLRIEHAPFEVLVIEAWGVRGDDRFCGESRHISIAHYYANGDLDIDTELMDNGYPIATQHGTGQYQRCYSFDEIRGVLINLRERAAQLSFMRGWARTLRAHGFVQAAKAQRAV